MKGYDNQSHISLDDSIASSSTMGEKSFDVGNLYRRLEEITFPGGGSYLLMRNSKIIAVGHWRINRPADKEFIINFNGTLLR